MSSRRSFLKSCAALGCAPWLAGLALPASAAGFPSRPVRVTTPFPPGAGPDVVLRVLGERLGRRWSQPVVVENRPGGNGFIAVNAFRQAAADGHDLIQLDSNHITTHPHTFGRLPYDVQRDFTPIAMLLRTPFFIAVAADSPFESVDDIVAAARPSADAVTYGSWFNGSPGHIGGLRLLEQQGVQMVHVPFRDFGALYQAVSNKEVDWALASAASGGPMERAGRLRFLALAASRRDPLYPDVPATAEIRSLKGFEVSAWAGLFGPGEMPDAVRDRIAADIGAAMAEPETIEHFRSLGYEMPGLSPTAFAELIRAETRQWGEVIRAADLKLD